MTETCYLHGVLQGCYATIYTSPSLAFKMTEDIDKIAMELYVH